MAHNESNNPDSVPIDITDCYDDDTQETRRMMHTAVDLKTRWEEEGPKKTIPGQWLYTINRIE